jgi:hypothetical protein
MKISPTIIFALLLLLAGCESSQRNVPLTAEQAKILAMRLANDKADMLFHHRPFQGGQSAHFAAGHWIWTDSRGVGILDYQATVDLAADGSTNNVAVQVLDSALHPRRIQPVR